VCRFTRQSVPFFTGNLTGLAASADCRIDKHSSGHVKSSLLSFPL
jgi:hypothetical protein